MDKISPSWFYQIDQVNSMMRLDEKVLKTFCVAKSFKENDGGKVNSIHFSWDGLGLITSSEDDQIIIYDCERG